MINGLGYKLANVPTVTGLSSIVADSIISGTTDTSQLFINGVDVSTTLSQVPINTNNITLLQTATTGITYSNIGLIDLTTIDNNVTITSGKKLKTATVPTTTDDVVNKTYCDTAIANLVASAPATLDTLNELALALGSDPNFATTVASSIGGKVSLATGPQTVSAQTTMNNASNVFYGDGANLTNITSSAISTTSLPATGTYYLPWITASTGTVGLTPYSSGNISFDRTNNQLIVPNLGPFGQLKMTSADNTIRQIWNTFYNLMDTTNIANGTSRGRIYTDSTICYLELDTGHTFLITIGGPNVFQISNTSATFRKPVIAQGVALQLNDNVSKTTSITQNVSGLLEFTQNYISGSYTFSTQNASAVTTIPLTINSSAMTSTVPTTITTTVGNTTPSCIIKDSATSNALNFIPSAGAGSYNGLVQAGDNIVYASGTVNTEKLILTTHSDTTSGMRVSPNAIVIGSGGTTSTPTTNISIDGAGGTLNLKSTTSISIDTPTATFVNLPTCSVVPTTGTQLVNKTYADSAISTSLTNYMTLNTAQTVVLAGIKTFTNNIVIASSTSGLSSLSILATSSVPRNIYFLSSGTEATGVVEMVFGRTNNTKSCVSIVNPATTNDGGIFLQAVNGGYLYGRNDGDAFNTRCSGNSSTVALLYPIGYCFETLSATTKPVNATELVGNATIALTKGVWQISGYIWLSRGNGTFVATSTLTVLYPVITGCKIFPNSAGMRYLIPHTNTNTSPMIIPLGTFTIVCTLQDAVQTVGRTVLMTVGTTTTWYITFSGVKIA